MEWGSGGMVPAKPHLTFYAELRMDLGKDFLLDLDEVHCILVSGVLLVKVSILSHVQLGLVVRTGLVTQLDIEEAVALE